MSAPPFAPSASMPTLPTATKPAATLLEELAHLIESPLAAGEFYTRFFQRILAAAGGEAGAVRLRNARGDYSLDYQVNLGVVESTAGSNNDTIHNELLRAAANQQQTLWVPPRSGPSAEGQTSFVNLTRHTLLLAPILIDAQVAGFVEVWRNSALDARSAQALCLLLGQASGFVAAFLHRIQFDQLRGQQQTWEELQAFARQVHSSLDPEEVAHIVANEARRLIDCDQVSVAVRNGSAVEILSVSGTAVVDRRSPLRRSMHSLLSSVLDWGEKLVYTGERDGGLPPAVLSALNDYLVGSGSRLLIALPLRSLGDKEHYECQMVLLIEAFRSDFPREQIERKLELVTPHARSALLNAMEYRRVPLRWLSNLVSGLHGLTRGRRAVKLAITAGLVAALICTLLFVEIPYRVEARGELVPCDRQVVYSRLNGTIVEVKARHGENVVRGQELLLMEDLELQLQVEQLGLKIGAAEQRVAILNQQLGKATTTEERNALIKERGNQEYELRRALAERDILLQGSRNPRKTPVVSPLAGRVVTFDAREQLAGKRVKPGDPLLRVAQVRGAWDIEIYIPEGRIGAVRKGLDSSPDGSLDVELLLSSHPNRTFRGRLMRDGLGGETVVRGDAVALPARVQIADRDLLMQLDGMPVGVEVRAKINCGPRSLGNVWFSDFWEFVHERILF